MTKKKLKTEASTESIQAKATIPLTIPIREIEGLEGIALGFRVAFFDSEHGKISSGAGFGSVWIPMEWKGRQAAVNAGELLAAWVETFNPEDAAAIRDALKRAKQMDVQAAEFPVVEEPDA